MSVVSITTLKSYFKTGDVPTESQFADLIDTLNNASTSVYKRYVALLTQVGTAAPVATVLENTLGNIVWTRASAGIYIATLANAFPLPKTAIFPRSNIIMESGDGEAATLKRIDNNTLQLTTTTFITDGDFVDPITADDVALAAGLPVPFEIRVYP